MRQLKKKGVGDKKLNRLEQINGIKQLNQSDSKGDGQSTHRRTSILNLSGKFGHCTQNACNMKSQLSQILGKFGEQNYLTLIKQETEILKPNHPLIRGSDVDKRGNQSS